MKDREPPIVASMLPHIDETVVSGVIHDMHSDPNYLDRVLHTANEAHRPLVTHMVAEAAKFADGNLEKQVCFIRGAEFVLAVFQRQVEVNGLHVLWSQDGDTSAYDGEDRQLSNGPQNDQ